MKKLMYLPLLLCLVGCGPRSPETSSPTPAAEPASILSPAMTELVEQLDTGGVYFSVSDGQYEWEILEPFFQYINSMVDMMRMMEETGEIPPQVFGMIENLPDTLGLNQLQASGSSTIELSEGRYRSRSVMQTLPDADGLIWRLDGDSVDFAEEIRRLPETTVLMTRFAWNAPELYRSTKATLQQFPQLEVQIQQAEAMIAGLGIPMESLLESIKRGGILAISLNPESEWVLPGLNGGKIPEVGLMMRLSDPGGAIGNWAVQSLKAKSPLPMIDLEVEGVTVHSIGIPAPVATAVALQLVLEDGQLLIASSPHLMRSLIQAGKTPADRPLLAALGGIEDTKATQGWVARPDLAETVRQLSRDIAVKAFQEEDPEMVAQLMKTYDSPLFPMPYVALTQKEGTMHITTMLHDRPMSMQINGATIMTVPAVTGLLAAIALPSFQKARTTAQEKGCLNNLRLLSAAKDQWAIENGKMDSAPVTPTDISGYLRGIPECPQGGEYTLGTVGEDPVCSVPRHVFP